MEHPLVNNLDSLTIDEISTKLTELNRKLGIAQRMGNAWLCDQLRMAIENYTNKYMDKNNELLKKSGDSFNEIIDIS